MDDLIKRQDVMELMDWYDHNYGEIESYLDTIREDIKSLPSSQKTGKWIVHTEIKNAYGGIYIECSECGEGCIVQHIDEEIFCRTCGSKNGR